VVFIDEGSPPGLEGWEDGRPRPGLERAGRLGYPPRRTVRREEPLGSRKGERVCVCVCVCVCVPHITRSEGANTDAERRGQANQARGRGWTGVLSHVQSGLAGKKKQDAENMGRPDAGERGEAGYLGR